jgi:hypothetical protein
MSAVVEALGELTGRFENAFVSLDFIQVGIGEEMKVC